MTQEQKAQAYDEALGWMREMYPCLTDSLREDAEQEVDIVASKGEVVFFPVGDENTEIIHLVEGREKPFKAKEVKD